MVGFLCFLFKLIALKDALPWIVSHLVLQCCSLSGVSFRRLASLCCHFGTSDVKMPPQGVVIIKVKDQKESLFVFRYILIS